MPKLEIDLRKPTNEIQIAIFDITPVNKAFAEEIDIFRKNYSTENCMDFINTIVTTCKSIEEEANINIKLNLKHKHALFETHDINYIQLIKELCDSH